MIVLCEGFGDAKRELDLLAVQSTSVYLSGRNVVALILSSINVRVVVTKEFQYNSHSASIPQSHITPLNPVPSTKALAIKRLFGYQSICKYLPVLSVGKLFFTVSPIKMLCESPALGSSKKRLLMKLMKHKEV